MNRRVLLGLLCGAAGAALLPARSIARDREVPREVPQKSRELHAFPGASDITVLCIDGTPLERVASNPGPDQFSVGPNGVISIGHGGVSRYLRVHYTFGQ